MSEVLDAAATAVASTVDVATAAAVGSVVGESINRPVAEGGTNWKTVAILVGVAIGAIILVTMIRRKEAAPQ